MWSRSWKVIIHQNSLYPTFHPCRIEQPCVQFVFKGKQRLSVHTASLQHTLARLEQVESAPFYVDHFGPTCRTHHPYEATCRPSAWCGQTHNSLLLPTPYSLLFKYSAQWSKIILSSKSHCVWSFPQAVPQDKHQCIMMQPTHQQLPIKKKCICHVWTYWVRHKQM